MVRLMGFRWRSDDDGFGLLDLEFAVGDPDPEGRVPVRLRIGDAWPVIASVLLVLHALTLGLAWRSR